MEAFVRVDGVARWRRRRQTECMPPDLCVRKKVRQMRKNKWPAVGGEKVFPSLHFSFLLMTQDAPSFLATIDCVFLFSWPLHRLLGGQSYLMQPHKFLDIIHEAPLSGHREPRSIFGSALYCLLLASYAVVAAAAPWIFILVPKLIPTLLCSCNVLILILTAMFQQYWVYQVKKVRLQGYYSFSQRLKHIAQLPFATITYGSAMMLLVLVWQPYIKILSVVTLLRIVMLVEVICAGCFMSVYVGYIHQYNSLDGQPDILKSLYSALQPSSSLEDRRYYDGGRLSDQQMALLQYQRENLHYLNEEVATELAN
ncbi:hypothetical protein ZIOFF_046005 [Zingiber officinale]|uniref:Transmembrane protein 192 n=1 Tax=Zingiber officinale TaxID=94328 RepID=A0A8J5G1I4_ZINOF|nr:hypothetical protein ZIOFF_046005 [Zingiber officinale]